jgi:hypothetical protein
MTAEIVSFADRHARGWCTCRLCIATRSAWHKTGARQALADFLAEHEPRLGSDPWVSLACIADNRALSPMVRRQARTVLATVEEMCPVRCDRLGRPY